MRALLILNEKNGNVRVVVNLKDEPVRQRVVSLLGRNEGRAAFDLLKATAQFESFLPAGAKLPVVPQVTLVEDLI